MKKFLYGIWSKFLTWFGKIKVMTFHFLPILAYDKKPYFVTGYDIFALLEMAQPGDILIRGYDNYLDGKFIPDENGYSHAGLYVGGNEVIHAVAEGGVSRIHIVDFCISDRVMLLRPRNGHLEAIETAQTMLGHPYDFNFESDDEKVYCFELVAKCYPQAEMMEHEVRKFFGLVTKHCYLAKSIYGNDFFSKQFEKNNNTMR